MQNRFSPAARSLGGFFLFCICLFLSASLLLGMAFGRAASLPAAQEASTLTVIIDAGHGGEDGGAVSGSGLFEKDLNLAMAKQLEAFFKANGVTVVMTRETDTLLYDRTVDYQGRKKALDLLARRRIGEANPNAIFISIHMNAYPLPQYHGLQVWYSKNNPQSERIAESIQKTVADALQPQNDRAVKPATSAIYLLHHLATPAVLVECGFLSNAEEAEKLSDPSYRESLAFAIFLAVMEAHTGAMNE
jgi:N-acetylmuramoyl-L-alanine amidase